MSHWKRKRASNREYREGPYCKWPVGLSLSIGNTVAPCSARFDAWAYRADEHSTNCIGFRAWVVQCSFNWGRR